MRPLEILVIDGEPCLLRALRRGLSRAGYHCEIASDIDAARELLRRRGRHIDAVLIDWGLPDRGALTLADELWAQRPGLPVVLLTDLPPRGLPPSVRARPFHSAISKPFDPEELLLCLARVATHSSSAATE